MRCFLEKFTQLEKIYTTAGRDGRNKFQVWVEGYYCAVCHSRTKTHKGLIFFGKIDLLYVLFNFAILVKT